MNANKLIIVSVLLVLCNCTSQTDSDKLLETPDKSTANQGANNDDTTYIADSIIFSLDVLNSNVAHNFLIDDNKMASIVMTTVIQSIDRFFSPDDILEAIKYHVKKNKNPQIIDLRILTTISILKKGGGIEEICFFPNTIYPHEDGTYGISEFEIGLNDTLLNVKSRSAQKCLQVIIKPDEINKRTYFLNFVYKQNSWKLISRERYSNSSTDIENGERYCIDTTNNCHTSLNGFEISFDNLLNLENRICN